ncbi:MAG: hypothetical protein N3A38_15320, partial [Planctomycetota bacterium]|nr:hypothetical protein [Planctomycetota bacterium]
MTTRSGKRRVESGLPRFWQGVSMCFVAFLSAAAVIAGFLRDGGLEEAVRRAVAIKTRGRGSFETMEILPDGMLRLNGFSHGRAGVFPEIGPWRAREALLLAGPFSWPPAIKAVKLKGAGPVPVRFDPGLRDKGGPPDIPDYPLSFEDADFEIEAPPVGRLILGGCSGELSDEGSGVRAELRVSSLGGRDFPVRCRVEPGGRIRLESGAIELEGLGMHLLRALSPLAGLTGRVRIEQATLGGWPIETADAIVRLDRAGIRIGNPLDPCFIRNGSNGALSLHVERGRAEFSFPEGPGAAWFFEDGSGRREIASGIRGAVEWKAGDEGAAVTSVEISGSVAGRWALNFSAGGGDGEPRTWRWMFAPRAQMEGDMLPEPWRMAGMWRSGGPGGGEERTAGRTPRVRRPLPRRAGGRGFAGGQVVRARRARRVAFPCRVLVARRGRVPEAGRSVRRRDRGDRRAMRRRAVGIAARDQAVRDDRRDADTVRRPRGESGRPASAAAGPGADRDAGAAFDPGRRGVRPGGGCRGPRGLEGADRPGEARRTGIHAERREHTARAPPVA